MAKLGQQSDFEQIDDEERQQWASLIANTIATLLMAKHYDAARELTQFLVQNPLLREMMLKQVGISEETSVLMFAAFSLKLSEGDQGLSQDLTMNVISMFKNHVLSEVDNALEYDFRLNRDLMSINDTEEEGLLFEIPDKSNVEADAKESLLKEWIPREIELIKEIDANL